jgi:hypothetical protein
MISGAPPRVGTMRRRMYKPSCSTKTMAVPSLMTPRRGQWGGSQEAAVQRQDGWATRGVCLCARRPCFDPLLDLAHFGWTATASGTGVRRSAVRRHRLRCGKRMASNFSVLQQRLYAALRNGEVCTEYRNRKSVVY